MGKPFWDFLDECNREKGVFFVAAEKEAIDRLTRRNFSFFQPPKETGSLCENARKPPVLLFFEKGNRQDCGAGEDAGENCSSSALTQSRGGPSMTEKG